MIDVDYFKAYNDYYGHQAGDNCLTRLAQAFTTVATTNGTTQDLLARYGGEEFVLILPEADQTAAIAMAEALQTAIHNLQIPHPLSDLGAIVTLSIGMSSQIPDPGSPWETLCQQADQALYAAKTQGRNRYVCFESLTSNPLKQ